MTGNARDYSKPTKKCDIVMEGGITSGVVYPSAVCELATSYRFKSIGGASAGAIAAAGAAAAEYGRSVPGGGFDVLEQVPHWLGEESPSGSGSNLFSLFQPQRGTRPVFKTLAAALGKSPAGAALGVVANTVWRFPLVALVGALPGLVLGVTAALSGAGFLLVWGLISAVVLTAVLASAASLAALALRTIRALPANGFGLCSGLGEPSAEAPGLTDWLSDSIDQMAGLADSSRPLTFADLWGTRDPDAPREIDLQMMTTCLTFSRPYRLPALEGDFYFKPDEFRRLFPERVVAWMESHAAGADAEAGRRGFVRMPVAPDLPVVVAARLSLSFPVLISAIPLYVVGADADDPDAPGRVWFSDGGICSNFPVHFFDRPLPRCPTFAINLTAVQPGEEPSEDQRRNVWMANDNTEGMSVRWSRIRDGGVDGLFDFGLAVFNALQNWATTSCFRCPDIATGSLTSSCQPTRAASTSTCVPR